MSKSDAPMAYSLPLTVMQRWDFYYHGRMRSSTKRGRAPSDSSVSDESVRHADYLGREEVLKRLGIKQQTLYAYVSRGFIRSVAHPDGRSSYYVREDVDRMHSRILSRTGYGPVAAGAMRWGEPVMPTKITRISEDGPYYRGHSAIELARSCVPFENVAELLWSSKLAKEPLAWSSHFSAPAGLESVLDSVCKLHQDAHVVQLMNAVVLSLGVAAGVRRQRILAGQTPLALARDMIRVQAGTLGFLSGRKCYLPITDHEPIAAGIARVLGIRKDPRLLTAINAALVIAADHEFNPATFAARVAASGSCDLHSSIGAALSTHYGTLVGRTCDRVEALFESPSDPEIVLARVKKMLASAQTIPGFDHPLYPHGDPRARYLIGCSVGHSTTLPVLRNMLAVVSRLEQEYGARPKVEFGLVFMCRALGLPDRTASGLYALGRTAGWTAHVLEQRSAGFVIRPRAQFSAEY